MKRALLVVSLVALLGGISSLLPVHSVAGGTLHLASKTHLIHQVSPIELGLDVNQFDTDIGSQNLGKVALEAQSAHASVLRLSLGGGWSALQPSQSGPVSWTSFDSALATLYTDHLKILLEMGNEPTWDAYGGNSNSVPSDCYNWTASSPSTWCSSVSTWVGGPAGLVNHLLETPIASSSPQVPEITQLEGLIPRNEPQNYPMNWIDPANGGAIQWGVDYAHFQQVVYSSAHQAVSQFNSQNSTNYSISVMNGGEELGSPQDRTIQRPYESVGANSLVDNGGIMEETMFSSVAYCKSVDVLDIHVGDHGPLWSVKMVDNSELALQACNGGKQVPIWVSESGYASIPQIQNLPEYENELGGNFKGGQLGQARYLYQTLTSLEGDSNVVGIDWTFLIDPNTTDMEVGGALHGLHNSGVATGLYESNPDTYYSPKESLGVFSGLAQGSGQAPAGVTQAFVGTSSVASTQATSIISLSCVSSQACFGVGTPGEVEQTNNGGQSWTELPQLPNVGVLNTISCYGPENCMAGGTGAAGAAIITTTNAGATWNEVVAPSGVESVNSIDCVSSTSCIGVGDSTDQAVTFYTTNFGNSFQLGSISQSVSDLQSVSCMTPTSCVAVGDGMGKSGGTILESSNAGASWTPKTTPTSLWFFQSVTCPNSVICYSTGETTQGNPVILVTSDGASTWEQENIPGQVQDLYSISCVTSTSCIAGGDTSLATGVLSTQDGGSSWVLAPAPTGVSSVVGTYCQSSTECFATGSGTYMVIESVDSGLSWTGSAPSDEVQQLLGISCVSQNSCVAVGDTTAGGLVLASANQGQSWTSVTIPSSVEDLYGISCMGSTCVGVGDSANSGVAIYSSDSGQTFQEATGVLSSTIALDSVSCWSISQCVAVGDQQTGGMVTGVAYYSSNGGSSWTQSSINNTVFDLFSVSCSSSTVCVAVGDSGSSTQQTGAVFLSNNAGLIFSSVPVQASSESLDSVFCIADSGDCWAGGQAVSGVSTILSSIDSGVTWTDNSTPSSIARIMSISCSSITTCTAVGAGDTPSIVLGQSQTWTVGESPQSTVNIISVSCPGGTSCVGVGGSNTYSLTTGSAGNPPPTNQVGGYLMLDSAGQVFSFGTAQNLGSASGGTFVSLGVVGGGNGYWILSNKGEVDAFGTAGTYSVSPEKFGLSAPVVIIATPDGKGFWIATQNGQVLTGGDAGYFGSPAQSSVNLSKPIVSMASTPDGQGYWLLGGDGGVFAYGDAGFYGSTGSIHLNEPAVAMSSSYDGKGYLFVAGDGGVFAYGDAGFYGSMGGKPLAKAINGIVTTSDAKGYWMVASDGGVFAFGDAPFVGSLGANPPPYPVIGFAPSS